MSRSVGGFSNSGHLSLRAVVQSCLFEANSYLQSCKFARNNDPLGGDFRVQFRPPSYLHANCAMPDRRECALDRVRGAQMRPMLGGKIKERQQRIAVLEQAIDGFVVFGQPAPTCLLLAPRRTSAFFIATKPDFLEAILLKRSRKKLKLFSDTSIRQ